MFRAEIEAPVLACDPMLENGLVDRLLESEKALRSEIIRLQFEAEAMETELIRALDISQARAERTGLTRRIALLEAELEPAVREHGRLAARIAEMEAELQSRDGELRRLAGQIKELDSALMERDRKIRRMRSSLSWRLAAPIRAVETWLA